MMSVAPITPLQYAEALRKDGKFEEALQLYRNTWKVAVLTANEWDYWGFAYCLVKTKDYPAALDFCRKAYPLYPSFAPLNNMYAWAVYHTAIVAPKPLAEADFLKAAKGIMRLCLNGNDYSPFVTTVFKVLQRLTAKNTFPAAQVLEWTALLSPERLDDTPFSYTDAQGKTVTLASKREQYYSLRSKALLANKQYQACIDLSEKALAELSVFHYGNALWLERNIALAHRGLGDFLAGMKRLEAVWTKRKEWFLALDLAEMATAQGDNAAALAWCLKGVLMNGDTEKKVKLFKHFAAVLMRADRVALALKHYELVALIREEQSWSADAAVTHLLAEHQVKVGAAGASLVLLKALAVEWKALQSAILPRLEGTILKMMPNGNAGFVKNNSDGKSYYFAVKHFRGDKKSLKAGLAVSYVLEKGFDKVKQKEAWNAVEVRCAKYEVC